MATGSAAATSYPGSDSPHGKPRGMFAHRVFRLNYLYGIIGGCHLLRSDRVVDVVVVVMVVVMVTIRFVTGGGG